MAFITYETKNFHDSTMRTIARAHQVCSDYARRGYNLTLRQLYYQFVSKGWIANDQREYDRLGRIVSDGRMTGHLDWNWIVDRTRSAMGGGHWDSPEEIIKATAGSYSIDKWQPQDYRVEVWVEKEALASVVARAAGPLDVTYFSCRGYPSQTSMHDAGMRILEHLREDTQKVWVLHLGDHDPSGIDMTRDIEDRLRTFVGGHLASEHEGMTRGEYEQRVEVKRIALNWDQVQTYNPPPNPAKLTDSRAGDYVARFGYESWELDALDPDVLVDLIRDEVEALRDDDLWDEAVQHEEYERDLLRRVADNWAEVQTLVDGQGE